MLQIPAARAVTDCDSSCRTEGGKLCVDRAMVRLHVYGNIDAFSILEKLAARYGERRAGIQVGTVARRLVLRFERTKRGGLKAAATKA
jgi:hypothetical protein